MKTYKEKDSEYYISNVVFTKWKTQYVLIDRIRPIYYLDKI